MRAELTAFSDNCLASPDGGMDAEMKEVDAVIRRRLASEVVLIDQISQYIIGAGGKRMRPALVLLTSGACGYTGAHRTELAAVVDVARGELPGLHDIAQQQVTLADRTIGPGTGARLPATTAVRRHRLAGFHPAAQHRRTGGLGPGRAGQAGEKKAQRQPEERTGQTPPVRRQGP